MSKSPITCHVLDSSIGRPAEGVEINLQQLQSNPDGVDIFRTLAKGVTNSDGRCTDLLPPRHLERAEQETTDPIAGKAYKIIFKTGEYFSRTQRKSFYPWVEITFSTDNPEEHYHIPLLISPYSFTTYRGS